MKIQKLLIFLFIAFTSCLSLAEHQLDGPYKVAPDPVGAYKTLYYSLAEGLDAERIRDVQRVGFTNDFIFAESGGSFYAINRNLDRASHVGDPAVQSAISKPLNKQEFKAMLDSLGLADFVFQYAAND